MNSNSFRTLFAVEDRHFWFRARNAVINAVVCQAVEKLPTGYRVLEVGCGTGNVLRVLEKTCDRGTVMGMDLFVEGLQYARARTNCPLVQGDMSTPPYQNGTFNLIGLFDVLEHLSNDKQVLLDVYNLLDEQGILLLTVPAHLSLWSYFDESSGHQRRYSLVELSARLTETGYKVEYLTQYMAIIFPFIFIGRRIANLIDRCLAGNAVRRREFSNVEFKRLPVFNEILAWLLFRETSLIACRRILPFGTSLLAVARKTPDLAL